MSDDVANSVRESIEEEIATMRELNNEEIASVGGGLGAKQYMPYTPAQQDPFDPLPQGHATHKIHYY